ncbi:MAG: hypothetical protein Q9190_006689 [Brigantiaea leucoxantha]
MRAWLHSPNHTNAIVKTAITTSKIFSDIYERQLWGKGLANTPFSGPGSHNAQVVDPYISAVRMLIADKFSAPPDAVDLGCGDFNIGRQIRNVMNRYIACDIVPNVINYNRLIHASEDVDFRILNLVTEALPAGDVVIVRQVLQHLSNDQISRFLPKLRKYKWLILTESIPSQDPFVPNHDMGTGEFARLDFNSGVDLTKTPFGLEHYNATVISEVFSAYHKDGEQDRIRTTAYQLQKI